MPDYSDTKVKDMVFNILDSYTYNSLSNDGQLNNNQLYFITNDGDTSIDTSTKTADINLAHGGKYELTAGGYSTVFTLPNGYSHPSTTAVSAAAVKVGKDNQGHVVLGSALTASDVGASPSNHTHSISLATDTGTSAVTLSHGGKYKLTAGGQSIIFTMPSSVTDTNYYHKTGSWNGLKYTAGKVGSPDDLEFTIPTGTTSTTVALGNHTHTLSLATDTGTSQLTLSHGGKYKLTAGGNSYIFTMPSASTDTNYYHKTGSWSGLTYTAGKVGSPDDLAFTIPTGTTATTVSPGNHTHTLSLATDTGTSSITLSHGGKYKLTAGGSTYIFTMPSASTDTNYYHKTGSWSGLTYTAGKVGSPDDLAFTIPTGTTASTVAIGNHTHSLSIAASTGTNQLTLSHGGKYQLTAGGSTYIFTMPSVGTIPTITLNGSATTTPSFYAPTSAGTNGYVLKSNGSGAPSWASATLTDENVKQTNTTSSGTYRVLFSYNENDTTETTGTRKNTNFTYNPTSGVGLIVNNDFALGSTSNSKGRIYSDASGTLSGSETTITPDNVATYFEQQAIDATYPWTYDTTNAYWYVAGTTQDVHNLNNIVTIQWKALSKFALKIHYRIHSEGNYDFLRVWVNDVQKFEKSGNNITGDSIIFLKSNDIVKIIFRKDGSGNPTGEYYRAVLGRQSYSDLNVITVKQPFRPELDNTYSLGTTDLKWSALYIGTDNSYGSSSQPIYWDNGKPKACTNLSVAITLNGSSTTSASFYAPTSAGTSGYYLKSNGSGNAPTWTSFPTIPTITLNGSSTTSPSFYAPTSSGTANQILVSGGANTAPTWKATANGAAYATSSNGALTFGTLPVAQGGTGTTSFTANSVVISGSSTTSALTTRSITDSSSASAISTNTSIPTERDIYYGLPTINNSHSYTSSTTIYAPTEGGTANQILVSAGSTSAPTWKATASGAAYATSSNGALTFGTLPVAQGGTGLTTTTYVNAVVIGNSTTATNAMQTIRTGNGAFYATAQDGKPQFGTLPVGQGGTGATTFTSGALLIGNGTSAVGTRSITNNTSNTAISTGTNIPTMNTIYYGLVTVNGSSQTRATGIYAPTSAGTSGQYLQSNGSGAPSWVTLNVSDEKVKLTSNTGSTAVPLVLGPTSITSGTSYNCLYNTNLKYTPSTGNLQTTQINGVTVGSSPKFTDTVTTVSSSGSGNVVTGMSASNGAITYTMGTVNIVAAQIIRW